MILSPHILLTLCRCCPLVTYSGDVTAAVSRKVTVRGWFDINRNGISKCATVLSLPNWSDFAVLVLFYLAWVLHLAASQHSRCSRGGLNSLREA